MNFFCLPLFVCLKSIKWKVLTSTKAFERSCGSFTRPIKMSRGRTQTRKRLTQKKKIIAFTRCRFCRSRNLTEKNPFSKAPLRFQFWPFPVPIRRNRPKLWHTDSASATFEDTHTLRLDKFSINYCALTQIVWINIDCWMMIDGFPQLFLKPALVVDDCRWCN